jgi:SAM-dependent methyltransferase
MQIQDGMNLQLQIIKLMFFNAKGTIMAIQEKVTSLKAIVNGYKASRIVSAAEQLKIFDNLSKEPISLLRLSEIVGVKQEKLSIILHALVCLGLISKCEKGFFLSAYFDVLSKDSPRNQLGYIRHATNMMNAWVNLSSAIKEEHSQDRETSNNNDSTTSFIQAMNANALPLAKYISENFDFENHYILDIGAGAGTYSIAVANKYPSVKGIMIDMPKVTEIIQKNITQSLLENQFEVKAENYNNRLPDGQFDDIFLFAVAHQENDDSLNALLKKIFQCLKNNGRLFLTSFFLNEGRISPEFSVIFGIEMLLMTHSGKVYTHNEILEHLNVAGFSSITRIDDIPGPSTLYMAKK